MDNTTEKQYKNLRENYDKISDTVLGKYYYNEASDVYKADEFTARDIIEDYSDLKTEKNLWKALFWICFVILTIYILSNHITITWR